MTSFIVMPWVYKPYRDECLKTLKRDVFEVNNSEVNRGVAKSWNVGIENMGSADWLIILSASMRFRDGGKGLDHLDAHPEAKLVYFIDKQPSWRLVAIHHDVIAKVGNFDENFYPAYFEDADYELRAQKAGFHWSTMPIEAEAVSNGHGVELGGVRPRTQELINYFATKWGRHPSAKKLASYDYPFDDSNNNLAFWPTGGNSGG